jgi:hypothetical protein
MIEADLFSQDKLSFLFFIECVGNYAYKVKITVPIFNYFIVGIAVL